VAEIVSTAVEHGVALELNNHSFDPRSGRSVGQATEREFAVAARDAGAWISLGSDAHYHTQVGDLANALAVVEEIGFPFERIVNRDAASTLAFLNARRDPARGRVEAHAEVGQ
jgi:putative hydrolase